jgi:hypothetical protein
VAGIRLRAPNSLTSRNRRSENVRIIAVVIAEIRQLERRIFAAELMGGAHNAWLPQPRRVREPSGLLGSNASMTSLGDATSLIPIRSIGKERCPAKGCLCSRRQVEPLIAHQFAPDGRPHESTSAHGRISTGPSSLCVELGLATCSGACGLLPSVNLAVTTV